MPEESKNVGFVMTGERYEEWLQWHRDHPDFRKRIFKDAADGHALGEQMGLEQPADSMLTLSPPPIETEESP